MFSVLAVAEEGGRRKITQMSNCSEPGVTSRILWFFITDQFTKHQAC